MASGAGERECDSAYRATDESAENSSANPVSPPVIGSPASRPLSEHSSPVLPVSRPLSERAPTAVAAPPPAEAAEAAAEPALSDDDAVLGVGMALLCLLLDQSGTVAAIETADSATRWSEESRPLGRWLLYDLREAGAPAHHALAEIVGLLALLHVHLQLDDTVWVKILCLLERCVRAGMPVNAQTLRPLCIAAVSIAVKENYDEGMSANDVRRALPHLTLWHLGFIELDLLQLIGWRATIWEASEWTAYVAGLRTLLTETAADLRDFAQRYGEVINTIVETPLISPRPPPAASE